MRARRQLGVGERGPDFVFTVASGSPSRFYAVAGGRPIALLFGPGGAEQLTELSAAVSAREDVAVMVVTEPDVAEMYGVDPAQPMAVVLDPGLRIVAMVSGWPRTADLVALLDAAVHRGPAAEVRDQAPVLFVPNVVDAELRGRLMAVSEREGTVETGVQRGPHGEVLEAGYKRRRDHTVSDPDLLGELSTVVGRRVMPEVRKAFAFRATRFEGFKIACYDAAYGGLFRAHRDNLSPTTAHRVFALTINLNDDYDGGQLRFPEYGNLLYRPDAGAALVFSCAHLHEVREVTVGRRFVLLSFLYGEPGSTTRAVSTQDGG